MNMKKWIKAFPIVALLFMTVVAQAEEKPKVIRIGGGGNSLKIPAASGASGWVNDQGLLEKEFAKDGIKIERTYYTAMGPGQNEAIASGLIDFGSAGDLVTVVGRAGGLPYKIISTSGAGGSNIYIQVNPASGIKSLKDLKGKRIGYQKGTYLHLAFNRVLEAVGLTEKDIRGVNLVNADAQAALATNSVDAIVSSSDRPLVDQGVATLLFDTRKYPQFKSGPGSIFVTEAFANKYPEITKRVLKTLLKGYYWASKPENQEAIIQSSVKLGGTYKHIKADLIGALPPKERYDPTVTPKVLKDYQEIIDFAFKRGIIKRHYNVSELFDLRFQAPALKELGYDKYWVH